MLGGLMVKVCNGTSYMDQYKNGKAVKSANCTFWRSHQTVFHTDGGIWMLGGPTVMICNGITSMDPYYQGDMAVKSPNCFLFINSQQNFTYWSNQRTCMWYRWRKMYSRWTSSEESATWTNATEICQQKSPYCLVFINSRQNYTYRSNQRTCMWYTDGGIWMICGLTVKICDGITTMERYHRATAVNITKLLRVHQL